MEKQHSIPGYTGYRPQYKNDDLKNQGGLTRDNRYFIPGKSHTLKVTDLSKFVGYAGYVPKIKSENAFGESYGRTTGASVGNMISQGVDQTPEEKFQSMTQVKYTDQHVQTRLMRPADTFEPGFDTVTFESPKK